MRHCYLIPSPVYILLNSAGVKVDNYVEQRPKLYTNHGKRSQVHKKQLKPRKTHIMNYCGNMKCVKKWVTARTHNDMLGQVWLSFQSRTGDTSIFMSCYVAKCCHWSVCWGHCWVLQPLTHCQVSTWPL